jgi:pyrroline-5-carboxylate reductase
MAAKRTPIGVIGAGNMGGAIIEGLLGREDLELVGCDLSQERIARLAGLGMTAASDPLEVAALAKTVILAVKPQGMAGLLGSLASKLGKSHCLVSIAAGISMETLGTLSKDKCPVVRVMPNTPAMVGAGVFALCLDDLRLTPAQKELVTGLFTSLGQVHHLPEKAFDAFTAVCGSGPAYVFYVMDALVDAAVAVGLPRPDATRMVKALFSGSAKLAEALPLHLSQLREMVTSPGGTTIAATQVLDSLAVRGAFMQAVAAAKKRSEELG